MRFRPTSLSFLLPWLCAAVADAAAKDTATATMAKDTVALEMPVQITVASKSPSPYADATLPAKVVGRAEMRRTGASTLSDVLAEQTGLTLVHDHGTGVQMQGLAPDYTLVLVDGEPAVGRTAGSLELDRFLVGGVEQVEIVKGPSSSLYGSEALGGVINLVTRKPSRPLSATFNSRYGSNATLQTGASVESRRGPVGLSLFVDRTASEGYDLTPLSRSRTAPRYQSYGVQPKAVYEWSEGSRLTLAPRFHLEKQQNSGVFQAGSDSLPARDRSELTDIGLSATVEQRLGERLEATFKGYATRYRAETSMRLDSAALGNDDSLVSATLFDQRYVKGEAFLKASHARGFASLAGGGGVWESVRADRVDGGQRSAGSGFVFVQEEYSPGARFNSQASLRLDAHQDYAASLSPRLSARWRAFPGFALKASAGKGFKAPSFQELYMDFTNPAVGYSVFGAAGAAGAVDRLEAQGQIAERLVALGDYDLKPEHSWAFNAGADAGKPDFLLFKVNFFRNDVSDLIDSRPVARKTNGQNVFTYFNLSRIHTYGVEHEAFYRPFRPLTLEAGYQYLTARDDDVLDSIEAGRVFKEGSTGVIRPVQKVEYGGLFNRSRHSGNVKATWEQEAFGLPASLSVRGLLRGRYGYADRNGNGILDSDNEYSAGYALWNVSFSVKPERRLALEMRIDNVFDEVRPLVPLPGRLVYAGIRLQTF